MEVTPIPCVGAVIRDERGRLLLIRRGQEPGRGRWSIPGGRVEPGETHAQATMREVWEETGLHVVLTGIAGTVRREAGGGAVYEIEDFYARLEAGSAPQRARAGDDASEVGWFTADEVVALDCVEGLVDQLQEWRVLPQTVTSPEEHAGTPQRASR